MERTNAIFRHLNISPSNNLESHATASKHFSDSDDDVVIVEALRTPLCRAARGSLKDTYPDDMLATVFKGLLNKTGVQADMIQDICVGNVNQHGSGGRVGRIAQFFAGMPYTVPVHGVNRMCASGLQACASIAASIKAGDIDIGIGSGVETMTMNPMNKPPPGIVINPKSFENQLTIDALTPMGVTSENVAERFGITREEQDRMAFESNMKAARAQKNGYFDREIVPITTTLKDKEGNEQTVTVRKDDGVRAQTTMEGLAKLKPVFKKGGSTTAGNASQLTDGAAGVILARRSYAKKHNLPIFGVFRAFKVVGVEPSVMGIGPAYAIPAVLERTGLSVSDIDLFEVNEAFASQAYYSVKKVGIPMEKVNVNGGAIALGHPLGATGARQIATLLHEMDRRGKPGLGVVSMCMGTGMGAAAVIEYPGK